MNLAQGLSLILVIWNFIVFLLYGLDKGKAQQGLYRIPEKVLLSTAFFLGGIGAMSAGFFFHHKTRKWYFKLVWIVGIALDLYVIYLIWR